MTLLGIERARAATASTVVAAAGARHESASSEPYAATRFTAADLAELCRLRIGGFVFFSALCGALLATGTRAGAGSTSAAGAALGRAAEAALWIAISSAAASVFNQVLERASDARMQRTAARPLPAGRMRVRDAILFGAGLAALSISALALRFGPLAALLALSTLAAYALVYTPLKRVSSLHTAIGAIPGAMPPLLGYAALAGEVGGWGWWLFALVFGWQFPHFFAIGWLHRADYARAGIQVLAVRTDARGVVGLTALGYALALIPVSLLPVLRGAAGPVHAAAMLVLGLGYALAAARFARDESDRSARALLRVSLVYLPLALTAALVDPAVHFASPILP